MMTFFGFVEKLEVAEKATFSFKGNQSKG